MDLSALSDDELREILRMQTKSAGDITMLSDAEIERLIEIMGKL